VKALSYSKTDDSPSNTRQNKVQGGKEYSRDNVYARLRRLEQRIERIEAVNSTLRRDLWRIEKKLESKVVPSQDSQDIASQLKGLFG